MAWWKYRSCGHLAYVNPPRSMHTTPKDGYCVKCSRRQRLGQAIVTVKLRRILFVSTSVQGHKR